MAMLNPKEALIKLITDNPQWADNEIEISARALTAQESIGNPSRRDFPLLAGKELLVQATINGYHGQAFTSDPLSFSGKVAEITRLENDTPSHNALIIATLNALARMAGLIENTVHCRDNQPEECALRITEELIRKHGEGTKIGIIGYQPAILEACAQSFGTDKVRITDLNPDNIGSIRYGVEVWNGVNQTAALIEFADLLLVTGTTMVNDTFTGIQQQAEGLPIFIYGTTGAALAAMNGIPRLCMMSS